MASDSKIAFGAKLGGATGVEIWKGEFGSIKKSEIWSIKKLLKSNCSLSSSKKGEQVFPSKRPGPMRSRSVVKLPRTYPYSIPQRQDRVPQRGEIVKHTSEVQLYEGPTTENVPERQTIRRPCRTPSPTSNPSEFYYLSKHVNRHPISPGRNHSPKRTRTRSRSPNNRITLTNLRRSPTRGSGDLLHVEAVKSRIKKLSSAKLYLLRQPGPYSFTVASGKSAEHTFKVSIGPQTCTCSQTKNCLHVLFVMLRVFKVKETEPCLFSKTLKNYEVESLFSNYKERLKSRLPPPLQNGHTANPDSTTENENDIGAVLNDVEMDRSRPQPPVVNHDAKDDIDMCAICLLPMLESESLVSCDSGCKNKLHQLCMDIWSDECIRQNDMVICPLCRCFWLSTTNCKSSPPQLTNDTRLTVAMSPSTVHPCQNDFISSSTSHSSVRRIPLALNFEEAPVLSSSLQKSIIPSPVFFSEPGERLRTRAKSPPVQIFLSKSLQEPCKKQPVHVAEAKEEWIEAFGSDVAHDVQARGWATRENALKKMISHVEKVMLQLGTDDNLFDVTKSLQWVQLTEAFADVLSVTMNDPVYKIYHSSLQGLSTLLGFYLCVTDSDAEQLQNLVRPIVRSILTKCADGNSRTAQLSMEVISALCSGQSGCMAVGQCINAEGRDDVCGINFVLSCILESDRDCNSTNCSSWQRGLGRLYALDELMELFPQEFHLLQVQENKENVKFSSYSKKTNASKQSKLVNYNRIMSILAFSLKTLKASHPTVRKMSERLYIRATRLTYHVRSVYMKACMMLSSVDGSLLNRLRDRTPSRDSFLSAANSMPHAADERVLYTSVRLPSRRHSLGRSVPVTPMPKVRGKELQRYSTPKGSPVTSRRFSLPLFQRSASASPTPMTRNPLQRNYSISSTANMDVEDEPSSFITTRPRRPNFLPLNRRYSLEAQQRGKSDRQVPPRHSTGTGRTPQSEGSCAGGDGPCCYNRVCHVHALPCDGNCHDHNRKWNQRHRPPPSVPPNTPQCPVGDLIDLSAPALPAPMAQHPSLVQGVAMSLLDAIPEANSANLLALKCQRNCYPDSSSSPSPWSPGKNSVDMEYDLIPNVARITPSSATVEKVTSRLSISGKLSRNCSKIDGNNSLNIGSTYAEGENWTRCELLGTGGFSSCYLGRDTQTGALMAVKQVSFNCIDAEEKECRRAEICDEIRMMMKLSHPNIVRLLGASQQEDHYDMFVEWMPGGSVAAMLNKFGPFTDGLIALYTIQVLSGLDYLHDNCILHRDLKGANLLIDSTGQNLRIADFGAAKRLATQNTLPDELLGDMLGTIAFMAPEVLRGESYGRKCDIWSVGCCVIEMVTTKPPWDVGAVTNNNALIYKVVRMIAISETCPPIPDTMSPLVRDFALQCLRINKKHRPTVKELQDHRLFTLLDNE